MNYIQFIKNSFIGFYFTIALVSCNSNNEVLHENKLEIALHLSGDNRPELEKVLAHYSRDTKDSLKLKSAKFLIENMISHQSMFGGYIENYILRVDSMYPDVSNALKMNLYAQPIKNDTLRQNIQLKYDITEVKADFLIQNIEDSFQIWENSNYSPSVSFDVFCEYLLPYKLGQEPLKLWKNPTLNERYSKGITKSELSLDIYSEYVTEANYRLSGRIKMLPDSLIYKRDRKDKAFNDVFGMRSMGVPSAIDFVPSISPNSHWVSIVNDKYINNNYFVFSKQLFNTPKVFRKTYSINATPKDDDNIIPNFVKDKYNKDITDLYCNVTSVNYDFGEIPNGVKYAYLSFFDNFSWKEIAWDKLKDGKATFSKMGRNVVYIPSYYDKDKKQNAKYPIVVNDAGVINEIITKKEIKCNLTLNRLFPVNIDGEINGKKFIDADILACNNMQISKLDSIGTISHYKNMEFDTVNLNSHNKYSTWVINTDEHNNIIGDIQFFDEHNNQLTGQYFGIYGEKAVTNSEILYLFDNDIFTSSDVNSMIGVTFKEPKAVSYVKYITFVDGGGVYPDTEYELFYFDNGEWVSLGRKVATDFSINYNDVPSDALFWLHNHTSRVHERPFTIVDGRIKFW